MSDLAIPSTAGGRNDHVNSRIRQSLTNYRAVKLSLFKNGDPWFGPVPFHFLPGRDATSLESLFKMISPKLDIMNGVSYMFDSEGRRITGLDQIMDGAVYICSSSKRFIPGKYGSHGEGFYDTRLRSPSPPKTNLFRKKTSSAPISSSGEMIR